jgi:hypothetical protein
MNCQAVQRTILILPDPRHIPEMLRDHVVGCVGCREWAQQVARLEGLLTQLPVPPAPANKKQELIDQLAHPEPVIIYRATQPGGERAGQPIRWFMHRPAQLAGGLAAAVLLAVGGWWLLTRPGPTPETALPTPRDPFVEKLVRQNIALAHASKPTERLQLLGGLADAISSQTRNLARVANPSDLNELAALFDKVIHTGLARQVETMPDHALTLTEKQELYSSLAQKLGTLATDAETLAHEVPPEAKPALQKIAVSAREGQKKFQP